MKPDEVSKHLETPTFTFRAFRILDTQSKKIFDVIDKETFSEISDFMTELGDVDTPTFLIDYGSLDGFFVALQWIGNSHCVRVDFQDGYIYVSNPAFFGDPIDVRIDWRKEGLSLIRDELSIVSASQ